MNHFLSLKLIDYVNCPGFRSKNKRTKLKDNEFKCNFLTKAIEKHN